MSCDYKAIIINKFNLVDENYNLLNSGRNYNMFFILWGTIEMTF
jgi:hypothetical protein